MLHYEERARQAMEFSDALRDLKFTIGEELGLFKLLDRLTVFLRMIGLA